MRCWQLTPISCVGDGAGVNERLPDPPGCARKEDGKEMLQVATLGVAKRCFTCFPMSTLAYCHRSVPMAGLEPPRSRTFFVSFVSDALGMS